MVAFFKADVKKYFVRTTSMKFLYFFAECINLLQILYFMKFAMPMYMFTIGKRLYLHSFSSIKILNSVR